MVLLKILSQKIGFDANLFFIANFSNKFYKYKFLQ